jgi:hypothetical protein
MLHQDYARNEKSRLSACGPFEHLPLLGLHSRHSGESTCGAYTQLGIKKRLKQSVFGQDSTFLAALAPVDLACAFFFKSIIMDAIRFTVLLSIILVLLIQH